MFVLSESHSVANQFLSEIRDQNIQKDRLRFRRNLERLGEILAYEISKDLKYQNKEISTPLGETNSMVLANNPVLISIMRAGIPFHQGFLNYFDGADNGFIGAYRNYKNQDSEFNIAIDYIAMPETKDKEVIIIDPMLASGQSLVAGVQHLFKSGGPAKIHIAAAIAAPEGLEFIANKIKTPYSCWLGAIDRELNNKAYIVPGLGDAGDLAFGPKD